MIDKVYIKKSIICNENGIFAKEVIEKDTVITWYYGDINYDIDHNKYKIDYITNNRVNNSGFLIGKTNINEINNNIDTKYGKGLGQFANDAIIYIITGKQNNSYFIQEDDYILLISSRKILINEEILVAYGVDYWIGEIKNNLNKYNDNFCNIIKILKYIKKLIYNKYKCNIYDFKIRNNQINFELEIDERWCNIINSWHHDNNFHFTIYFYHDKYYICNYCRTCKKGDIVDTSENRIFEYFMYKKKYIN